MCICVRNKLVQRYVLLIILFMCGFCKNGCSIENINIQPMSRYNGINKEELIKKRQEKMIYSTFYHYNYEPKVFNDVKNGENWVGDKNSCARYKLGDGLSEASIWINNPDILVHMSVYSKYFTGVYAGEYNPVFCVYAKQLLFKPLRIMYDKENKKITSVYRAYNVLLGIGSHVFGALDFVFSPINAYDVGFNYYTVVESNGMSFDIDKNKKETVQDLSGVVSTRARMTVCSPCYANEKESCLCYHNSENTKAQLTSKQAEVLFKFWREKPASKDDEADFYYQIKFVK